MITSQIDTAPKLERLRIVRHAGLITSQIDTAPKLGKYPVKVIQRLITSQIDTAPKPMRTLKNSLEV